MAENLIVRGDTREQRYAELLPQLEALAQAEPDVIARMANVAAALMQTFGWLWIGWYRVVGEELVLGPFQGPLACTRIRKGHGVCGSAWERAETIVVPDVEQFEGHIACSSDSRSEIVVPVRDSDGVVEGVLDIDSSAIGEFGTVDALWLDKVAELCCKGYDRDNSLQNKQIK